MEQFDVKEEEQQKEVTTFFEEGEVTENDVAEVPVPTGYFKTVEDKLSNSVIGFLQRPIQLAGFTWKPAQTWGNTVVNDVQLPADWYGNDMIREKLSGFRYLRCDFVIRLQVNAQPFNAGRLMLVFLPFKQQQSYIPSNEVHFGGVSGYRRVELDLSESTSVEFRIPYMSNLTHYDLTYGIGLLGSIKTYVYSSLTGGVDVEGAVWIRAENIDIQMPSGIGVFTKVGPAVESGPAQGFRAPTGNCECDDCNDAWNDLSNVKASGSETKIEPSKEESSFKISDLAKTIGSVAGAFTRVPVLGIYAAGVSWVSNTIGGVAAMFGFSKPLDGRFPQLVSNSYVRHMANYNGDSKAKVLAMEAQNQTTPPQELFGTKNDEMALATILQKPTFLTRFFMTNEDTVGDLLWSWPVAPSSTTFRLEGIAPLPRFMYRYSTYLSYLSTMFGYWRGGIKYKFKIVKTPFHSGRIRVTYIPGMVFGDSINTADIDKSYSHVYDIRQRIDFEFEVPYVWNAPWISLKSLPGNNTYDSVYTGVIFVEVLNVLVNPSSATNRIEFLVETCASEDFQFAIPRMNTKYSPLVSDSIAGDKVLSLTSQTVTKTEDTYRLGKQRNKRRGYSEVEKERYKELNQIYWPEASSVPAVITTPKVVEATVEVTLPPASEMPQERRSAAEISKMLDDMENVQLESPQWYTLFNKYVLGLPYGTAEDEVTIGPTFEYPLKQYTVQIQHALWNKFKKQNPQEQHGQLWTTFLMKYPVAMETGRAQSAIIEQRKKTTMEECELNAFTTGEAILSLRQILKRYERLTPSILASEGKFGAMRPYLTVGNVRNISTVRSHYATVFDRVSLLYRYMHGSLRLLVVPSYSGSTQTLTNAPVEFSVKVYDDVENPLTSTYNTGIFFKYVTQVVNALKGAATVLFFPSMEQAVELQVPFYQKYPAVMTGVGAPTAADYETPTNLILRNPYNQGTRVDYETNSDLTVYRSIGEDFSFGYMIGPPVVWKPQD